MKQIYRNSLSSERESELIIVRYHGVFADDVPLESINDGTGNENAMYLLFAVAGLVMRYKLSMSVRDEGIS